MPEEMVLGEQLELYEVQEDSSLQLIQDTYNMTTRVQPKMIDSSTRGVLLVDNGSKIVELPIGTQGQVLTSDDTEGNGIK